MRKNKYFFVLCMLLAISLAGGIFTKAYARLEDREGEGGLRVVTSFYPVYIAALNVVGDSRSVELENLSEPQTGCLHDYQLTPQDMILLSKAYLFLVNGGGIEGFLADVGESYPDLVIVEAAEGIRLLEESGAGHAEGVNAHGWMDTQIYIKMVGNIADQICALDPDHTEAYRENAQAYCEKVQGLSGQISEIEKALEQNGQPSNVVILHEAYAYVAKQYGLHTAYCLNLDEERQVSAREVAEVMEEIAENQVAVVFAEELYGKDMGNTIEAETDCTVCYLDPLVRGGYEPDSYLSVMQKNIDNIRLAFLR